MSVRSYTPKDRNRDPSPSGHGSPQLRREPARPELIAAATAAAARRRQENHERLVEDSLSVSEAARFTGASERYLRRLIETGAATAFADEGELRLPVWQLGHNAVAPIIEGSRELAQAFPGDLASLTDWLSRPTGALDGASPMDSLRSGDAAAVVALASAIGTAGR